MHMHKNKISLMKSEAQLGVVYSLLIPTLSWDLKAMAFLRVQGQPRLQSKFQTNQEDTMRPPVWGGREGSTWSWPALLPGLFS